MTRVTTADLDRLEFQAVQSGDHSAVAEQLLDLVFYLLIVLSGYKQVSQNPHFWVLSTVRFIFYLDLPS